jgi:multidrug efflux system membrane fusion protein
MKYVITIVLMFFSSVVAAAEYSTRLEVGRELILGVMVSGVVQEIKVGEGQRVKQGQLLLELDQREFKSELQRAKARANRANGLFDEALREEERATELYDRTLLSDHDLQKALIGRLDAESRKFEAATDLMQAKLNMERSRILAPVAGRITNVSTWKGQPLQNTLSVTPLIKMMTTDSVRFSVKLPEKPEGSAVRLKVKDKWYPVSSYTLQPDSVDADAWILKGVLTGSGGMPGAEARVAVE